MYTYEVNAYNSVTTTEVLVLFTIYLVLVIALAAVALIAEWKIFEKANKPGWAAFVPFYNIYTEFEIAGMNGWKFLLLFIPIVNIVVMIKLYLKLAEVFGKSKGFGIGLIFLNFIFTLILAFGSAKYIGTDK